LKRPLALGIGLIAAAELAAFVWHSVLVAQDRALSWDTALYGQAWVRMAHLDLNPYSTVAGFRFLGNHFELGLVLLAPLALAWPHPLTLLVVQDATLVAAQVVAALLVARIVTGGRHGGRPCGRLSGFLAVGAASALFLNPFVFRAVSSDFHMENVAVLPFVAAAALLAEPGFGFWVAFFVTALFGDVAVSWLAALSVGGLLGKATRRRGVASLVLSVACLVVMLGLGGDSSATLSDGYGYLRAGPGPWGYAAGAILHAHRAARQIVTVWPDAWANAVASAGAGLFGIPSLPVAVVVGLENLLNVYRNGVFAEPGFQWVPVYLLGPAYAASGLLALARRMQWLAACVGALCISFPLAYAVRFGPEAWSGPLDVSPAGRAAVARALSAVPPEDLVVVSQGLAGNFIGYPHLVALRSYGVAVARRPCFVLLDPFDGIETIEAFRSAQIAYRLIQTRGTALEWAGSGVVALRVAAPAILSLSPGSSPALAAALKSDVGRVTGEPGDPVVAATGEPGYLSWGAYVRLPPGEYVVRAFFREAAGARVEVWDDSLGRELGVAASGALPVIETRFRVVRVVTDSGMRGTFPVIERVAPRPPGDVVEARVAVGAGSRAELRELYIERIPS
jgi:hypothetical protein